jgi:hypothetical protein
METLRGFLGFLIVIGGIISALFYHAKRDEIYDWQGTLWIVGTFAAGIGLLLLVHNYVN